MPLVSKMKVVRKTECRAASMAASISGKAASPSWSTSTALAAVSGRPVAERESRARSMSLGGSGPWGKKNGASSKARCRAGERGPRRASSLRALVRMRSMPRRK